MKMIALSKDGPETSALGFGCNNFGQNPFGNFVEYSRCERVVHAALDTGYTFFDTAEAYALGESEEYLGKALGSRRDEVQIATKFGARGQMPNAPDAHRGSKAYIRWAIEGSLRRLDTDHIDLYQMHEPDPSTPIEETLGVLKELVDEGKVRHVGVGGFSADQLDAAAAAASSGELPYPVSSMTHYSLLHLIHEADVVAACIRLGIRVHPWFVLENGLLTGKFSRGQAGPAGSRLGSRVNGISAEVWDALDRLRAFADAHSVSMIELAIGGLAAMPGIGVVIVGASTPEQVTANAAARDWTPSATDLEQLLQVAAMPSDAM